MLVGVLTALGVLGAIGLLVVLFLQRGRDGMDVSLSGLLRLYLQPAFPIQVCPPGTTCPPFPSPITSQFVPAPDDRVRQQAEDLVRGVTFVIFGGVFWAAHWWARRALAGVADRASGLHRAYLVLGTAIFGIATIALLPMGIYQALSIAIVPPNQFTFRPGAGDALSGGLAALPLWLGYLWLVQRALRTAPPTSPTVA